MEDHRSESEGFLDIFNQGNDASSHQVYRVAAKEGVVGRIFKFKGESPDLEGTLSFTRDRDDPEHPIMRPYVFFTGSDGLSCLLQFGSRNVFDGMLRLGLTADWIDVNLKRGLRFCLVVIDRRDTAKDEKKEHSVATLATWDNLLELVVASDPQLAPFVAKFGRHCVEAGRSGFLSDPYFIKHYKSEEVVEASEIDTDKEIYLTPRRFLNLARPQTWIDFRVLLWTWYGANAWFAGNGRTVDSVTQQKGPLEYLVPNMRLRDLVEQHGAILQVLDVVVVSKKEATSETK